MEKGKKRNFKKKILALTLAFMMLFTMMPTMAWADVGNNTTSNSVEWAGTSNNTHNNNVTNTQLPKISNDIDLLWQNQIGHESWGSYYAGTPVVTGGYVYVTGQGKLWKIDKTTGVVSTTKEGIGSASGNRQDYMCTDGETLYISTGTSVTAVSIATLEVTWTAEGTFGDYRPIQLLEIDGTGYLWCNGNVFKVSTGERVTITYENGSELDKSNFAWSSGALVDNIFYVTDYYNIYAINLASGRVVDSITYSGAYDPYNTNASGGVVYDAASERLFWGSKTEDKLFSVKISNGGFTEGSLKDEDTKFKTVNTPVVFNGRIYLTGQASYNVDAIVQVFSVDSDDNIKLEYTVGKTAQAEAGSTSLWMTQSNPILSAGEDGFVYLYFEDYYGDLYILKDSSDATSGTLMQLADTPNPSGVSYPYSYEQFAVDNDGNIYCYNESGYLFCYWKCTRNTPTFSTNLSAKEAKYLKDREIKPLTVDATSATGGIITYQWQSSTNGTEWSDIENETSNSYAPASNTLGTSYYRCVATSTFGNRIHSASSNTAKITITDKEADVTASIKVTISNQGSITVSKDDILIAQQDIKVTDADNDGLLTVNDALIATHEKFYEDGASAGYLSSFGTYGLSINKLWGNESGAFGYWLNNASCWSLEDEVENGDYLTAFIYKDQTGYSDAYACFDRNAYSATIDEEITFTLNKAGYDESWNTVFSPCSGTSVKIIDSNNSVIPYTTDDNGQVKLKFESVGTYKVMAYKDDGSIVPAAASVTVTGTGTVTPPTEQNAKVTFTLKGDTVHSGSLHSGTYYPTWIPATTVELSNSIKTVGDVFKKVLNDNGYSYLGLEVGYISSITTPSGLELAEFTNGKDSGWMYTVNGNHPNVGLNNYVLSDGDVIVWHYTDNYKLEHDYTGPKEEQFSSVTTSIASGSATTTTPTEVTVSGTTATATVKSENAAEAIKQAQENKSTEIVLNVAASDTKGAETVKVQLDTVTVKSVAADTSASITVKTENGQVSLDREALTTIASEATGTTITLEVVKVDKPTETQQKAAGTNGQVLQLVVKSGDKIISDFNKGKATVTVEIPAKLQDKKVAAIHIAEDGQIEQMSGKTVKIDGKDYYTFETPHFSAFALVDAEELGLEVNDEEANIERIKELVSDMSLKASSSKTSKKNIKVTLTVDDSTAASIKEIKEMGYTVKYKYYRSTKKASKYQAKITKTTKSYTNTAGKKGTRYYYKARIQVYDKDGKLVAQTALTQCKYAVRIWSK